MTDKNSNSQKSSSMKIGIVGAGFAGTALLAAFHRLSTTPLEIILFEKTASFGTGRAYSTPFPFHLLNVNAQDMSIYPEDSNHFVNWLSENEKAQTHLDKHSAIAEQYAPRFLYGNYLQELIANIKNASNSYVKLQLIQAEVKSLTVNEKKVTLELSNEQNVQVDKVILAIGNNSPAEFSFPITNDINCIQHPWDYLAPTRIPKNDSVIVMGTGLSMIDTVLTLYHQEHKGKIYAVSRRGLLPLPHAKLKPLAQLERTWPTDLVTLVKQFRHETKQCDDWRSVVTAWRPYVSNLWQNANIKDRKRFLRHVLPYWNVHRHRVHANLSTLLNNLISTNRLHIIPGRIIAAKNNLAQIQLRQSNEIKNIDTKWLINCMGPSLDMSNNALVQSLLKNGITTLDPLGLGLNVDATGALIKPCGQSSAKLFTLGAPARGRAWGGGSVPEIRKQSFQLARHLLAM